MPRSGRRRPTPWAASAIPAAKPFLEAAKKDTNEGVKRAAKDALKALKKKA